MDTTTLEKQLPNIVKEGNLVRNPAQQEYAYNLITEFNTLHNDFKDFQAVKLLFTVPNSPTFNVADVADKVGDAATHSNGNNGFPKELDLEFTKAGFTLPATKRVQAVAPKYNEKKWKVSTILPADEAKTITGTGITPDKENPTVIFKDLGKATPTATQLQGTTLIITDGGGKGLSGTIASYAPGKDLAPGTATMAADWQPTPTADSQFIITPAPIQGTGITLDDKAQPLNLTLTLKTAITLVADQLKDATLAITKGSGQGLQGIIATNLAPSGTSLHVTMATDWGSAAQLDETSEFTITLPVVQGKGVSGSASPLTLTLPKATNVVQDQWKDATLTITVGPGQGLNGKISGNDAWANANSGTVKIGEDWKPTPGDDSQFSIEPSTTYTIKQEPDQLDIYADSDDPALLIQYRIGLIDEIISKQLSEILHHPQFQQLEASWRGLHDLVFNSETGTRLKLRLLNVPKQVLQDDLDNAVEFDQSALFKKVYEEEYGVFGGSPYSALLVDYEFTRKPQDINLLEKLSNVAAAAHAPVIAAAHPELFDLDTFTKLDQPRDLAKIFEGAEYIKWRGFRDSEDSRYVALALPHVLMRLPYGPNTVPVGEFNFVEQAEDPKHFLWGSAAWALGQRITTAFSLYGWTAAIRGYEGGGLVSGLPIYTYKTDHGDVAVRIPTEVAITDRREKELSDLGFIALCYRKETDSAAFFGGQTTNRPKAYLQDEATANARLSSQLPYMMAASRFAHYIKVMMRDKIGSFMTQGNVATFLNRWIAQYILLNDEAGQELKARYPLREARVDVTADPARPGCYKAVVFLRPHFQLEELTVSIRLVTQLPPPANA